MCSNDQAALDWAKYEGEILDLFVVQNKTLNDVMVHMEEEYNFQATHVTPVRTKMPVHDADDANMTVRGSTNTGFQALRTLKPRSGYGLIRRCSVEPRLARSLSLAFMAERCRPTALFAKSPVIKTKCMPQYPRIVSTPTRNSHALC